MRQRIRNILLEKVSQDVLRNMRDFGLSRFDIDKEGYVTLYHGGKNLPRVLNKDQIFFMTSNKEVAKDYARMRGGEIFQIRVRPEDVHWNRGTGEVEIENGGKILNGKFIPNPSDEFYEVNIENDMEYKGIKSGDTLPKTKWVVQDVHCYETRGVEKGQFLIQNKWYDADTVINYEFEK